LSRETSMEKRVNPVDHSHPRAGKTLKVCRVSWIKRKQQPHQSGVFPRETWGMVPSGERTFPKKRNTGGDWVSHTSEGRFWEGVPSRRCVGAAGLQGEERELVFGKKNKKWVPKKREPCAMRNVWC